MVDVAGLSGARTFYAVTALLTVCTWSMLPLASYLRYPVVTRPSWLPARLLRALCSKPAYLVLCRGSPLVMLCAAAWPDNALLRLAAAVWHTCYQLAESSYSHSHRDHAAVYCAWALALLPTPLASGVALGVCVQFIASSGLAKLHVAAEGKGARAGIAAWCSPATMRGVLSQYGAFSFAEGGPLSPRLNGFVARRDALLSLIAGATLLFECVLVPSALLLPPQRRLLLALVSVALHVGIALVQSFLIGVAFLPNLGTYLLGFGAPTAAAGSAGWCAAVAVVIVSVSPLALRGRLMPEDWPLTPFALFAWSGQQWEALFRNLVDSRVRLVLSPAATSPVGCVVVGKAGPMPSAATDAVVYDGWEQALGETLVFNETLQGLDFEALRRRGSQRHARTWAPRLAEAVEAWLRQERLVLAISGEALRHAFVVELEEHRDVVKLVLAAGQCEVVAAGQPGLEYQAADTGDDAVIVKRTRVQSQATMLSRAKQRPR